MIRLARKLSAEATTAVWRGCVPAMIKPAPATGRRTRQSKGLILCQQDVDQADDTRAKEEGVGLKVAKLEKAQDVPARPGKPRRNLHDQKIDDPAVHPASQHGETVLPGFNKPVVKVVDIETVGEERDH